LTLLLWSVYNKITGNGRKWGRGPLKAPNISDPFKDDGNPRVSVIIPCRNEAEHISSAVMSAVRQSYEGDIEVLVIDDGSSDMTWSIGRTLQMDLHRRSVKVLHKEKGGKASALTTGIKASSGTIIVTTDGDSKLEKDAVKEIVRTFRENPDAGIVGGYVSIQNTHVNVLTKLQEFEYLITQDLIRMNQSEDGEVLIAPGPVFGMRTDLSKIVNPVDRTVVEDCDLTQAVLSTKFTTRSNDRARSLTHAPESFKSWYRQRRRWIYGQFQSWRTNKWHLSRKPWAVYTYFTWVLTALSTMVFLFFLSTTIILMAIGSDRQTLLGFISIRTLALLIIYFVSRGAILLYHRETRGHIPYLLLLPIYDMALSMLTTYLYGRYLFGLGARVNWSGRKVVVH
jgi:cellulose synthase/poly-beta-1,6-N-acetylglucosamine synthase-like glycosyltransferase